MGEVSSYSSKEMMFQLTERIRSTDCPKTVHDTLEAFDWLTGLYAKAKKLQVEIWST